MSETLARLDPIITQVKDNYYRYYGAILNKKKSFYHSESPSDSASSSTSSHPKDQETTTTTTTTSATSAPEIRDKDPFIKRILIVDDEPDVTLTFGVGLEGYYYHGDEKRRFEVHPYNNPQVALSQFKPNFYDLMLTDIFMPHMNGFELCQKILELDADIRICFMSAAEANIEALREVYPKVSFGCFIKKPVSIEYLVKRLLAELD
jgi:CheY-like chemotaxis protein